MRKFFEVVLCVFLIIFWPITGWGLYLRYGANGLIAKYFRKLAIYGLITVSLGLSSILWIAIGGGIISKQFLVLFIILYVWNGIQLFVFWGNVRRLR